MHRFQHTAMATQFEIRCTCPDGDYARQAARAAFEAVDRLEQQLSRFVENSDITRINHLSPGRSTIVSFETMQCLQLASLIYTETRGAFDIALGTGFETLELIPAGLVVRAGSSLPAGLSPSPAELRCDEFPSDSGQHDGEPPSPSGLPPAPAGLRRPELPSPFGLRRASPAQPSGRLGVRLDLGAIGKGYAVDRIADVLEDWEIDEVLIDAGSSSVLALEPPAGAEDWPLTISDPAGPGLILASISARQRSLGASGIRKGDHIVDPRSGAPVRSRSAAWVSAPRRVLAAIGRQAGVEDSAAAVADALSTAFMISPAGQIDAYCQSHPGVEAWILEGELTHFSGAAEPDNE